MAMIYIPGAPRDYAPGVVFGKGGGGSAPSAPDPAATAAAQGQANKEAVLQSAKVNQIGTETPYGRTYYTGDLNSSDPNRVLHTELSPSGQQQLDQQNYIAGTLGDYGKQLSDQVAKGPATFDLSSLPKAPWQSDYSADANALEKATYDRGYNLLQPQFQHAQDDLETKLANQGITIGSDAYTRAHGDLANEQARALNDLSLGSVAAGRAEQSRLFGLGSSGRSQAMNEMLTSRTEPMNELSALLQGRPAFQMPSGASSNYQVQPADITGATMGAYNGAVNAYGQSQQAAAANNSATTGLLGTAAMAAAYFF